MADVKVETRHDPKPEPKPVKKRPVVPDPLASTHTESHPATVEKEKPGEVPVPPKTEHAQPVEPRAPTPPPVQPEAPAPPPSRKRALIEIIDDLDEGPKRQRPNIVIVD